MTVVDAVNGAATLDAHQEAVKQAAVADRIVLTKTDLLDTPQRREGLAALRTRLAALNPAAPMIEAARCERCAAYQLRALRRDAQNPRREALARGRSLCARSSSPSSDVNRHDDRIRAFTLASEQAIPFSAFEMFLDLVRSMHGPNLLRVKGIVKIAETPDTPIVIHGVQHVFHPPVTLDAWPDADHRTRLVFIVNDIAAARDRGPVQCLPRRCQGRPTRPRRADRQSADAVRRRGSFALTSR